MTELIAICEPDLRLAILDILSDGVTRSTEQVLSEFSAEFPQLLKAIKDAWISQNGFNCGAIQQPYTIISQNLEDLFAAGKVAKTLQGVKLWSCL